LRKELKRKRRATVLDATMFALAGVAILCGLGMWQLERKVWKENLIATLNSRLAAAPGDLPPRDSWRMLKESEAEFRRVTFPAEFLDGEEARLWEWQGTDNTYGSRHYVETARRDGSLATLKAMVLVDMIGDKDLGVARETTSKAWLQDYIAQAAKQLGYGQYFFQYSEGITDDHVSFLDVGIPAVDVVDAHYGRMGPQFDSMGEFHHANTDTMDKVSQRSLEIVGRTILRTVELLDTQ